MQTLANFGAKDWLFVALGLFSAFYLWNIWTIVRGQLPDNTKKTLGLGATGFVTAFFDTLGIGSFATTTSIVRHWKLVDDAVLPGTLNIGHTLPTIAQAYIFTKLVPVESTTLILMIGASVVGAWLGAGIVARWPKVRIQLGLGSLLLGLAALLVAGLMAWLPVGGDAIGLSGAKLVVGLVGNFVLGAVMTIGIGLYAPCMVLVSLLGMNATTAFPIMMGSCAFLMPISSARFIRLGKFDVRASLSIAVGALPAALIAGLFVVSLPLTYVKWLVVIVVVYTGINMIRAGLAGRKAAG